MFCHSVCLICTLKKYLIKEVEETNGVLIGGVNFINLPYANDTELIIMFLSN